MRAWVVVGFALVAAFGEACYVEPELTCEPGQVCTCPRDGVCRTQCLGSGCTFECLAGARCGFFCDEGGCSAYCNESNTCDMTCAGGNCLMVGRNSAFVEIHGCRDTCPLDCDETSICRYEDN